MTPLTPEERAARERLFIKTDKRSVVARIAKEDLVEIMHTPGYHINMSSWHEYTGTICMVCFAGSVMARTLKSRPSHDLTPCDFSTNVSQKMHWLNRLRSGVIPEKMGCVPCDLELLDGYVSFDQNPKQFIAWLDKVILHLEEIEAKGVAA